MEALARARPEDAVLSEEGDDDALRLGAERVWIVDPLDGTREFSEPGREDWAVHVALWESGNSSQVPSRCPLRVVPWPRRTSQPRRHTAAATRRRLTHPPAGDCTASA
ncbi:3'-phosphoadenosine 5'-phosphate phosphatase [Mycobacterium xenopi 3993]|nr:3'-phosphoadenosine 5'-phosphate phosphatase [Mycobacterium xenopi 3993]